MFNVGDKVTIKRGKGGSQVATVVAEADQDGQYAVRTDAGQLRLVKADNLKAPAESTIGEGRLAAEINTLVGDSHQDDMGAIRLFVLRLSAEMPGLAARIAWPAESAEA
jgi:hypothetical protein